MATYPAVQIDDAFDDLVLAAVADFSPTAVEEGGADTRIFFATAPQRDGAYAALAARGLLVTRQDVDDEDWARRSQHNLAPVTITRLTIVPRPEMLSSDPQPPGPGLHPLTIVIQPSMGFGTGHHATTRLCLAALQETKVTGAFVLDVGTGSGILAIAAARLGASGALGIDSDADAIQSANENLGANPEAGDVRFELMTIADGSGPPHALPHADVVMANLTGALLLRVAGSLLDAVNPGGTLIISGILADEEATVRGAFSKAANIWRRQEDEWVGLGYSV